MLLLLCGRMDVYVPLFIKAVVYRSVWSKNKDVGMSLLRILDAAGLLHIMNYVTCVCTVITYNVCVCMATHIARVWINRVRLSILFLVSWTGENNISLYALAPEKLVSRDGFGNPDPRQPAHLHTQAESGLY